MTNIKVICGWCRKEFETDNAKNPRTGSYGTKICPHCGREVSSSKKEMTGNLVGKKHVHFPLKQGDVV